MPADKRGNSIFLVCKVHYINCILEEIGFNYASGNITYTHKALFPKKKFIKIICQFRIFSTFKTTIIN